MPTVSDEFPNADQIFPQEEAKAAVTLNVEYLLNVCKTIKDMKSRSGLGDVKIEIFDGTQPVRLSAVAEDGMDMTALIMPIRS